MYLIRLTLFLLGLLFVHQSLADIPADILRTCVDSKPRNESIKITELADQGISEVDEPNCENQDNRGLNGLNFGSVTCNDTFFIIIKDKKVKASSAVNKSVNPEIKPGTIFSNRSIWNKIDKNDKSYLCIEAALTESGAGAGLNQYYIVENAFDPKEQAILYYYFFNQNIIPITSKHF